jgi:preprotein translocase subunit YajC
MSEGIYSFILFVILFVIIIFEAPKKRRGRSDEHNDA